MSVVNDRSFLVTNHIISDVGKEGIVLAMKTGIVIVVRICENDNDAHHNSCGGSNAEVSVQFPVFGCVQVHSLA